MAKWQTNSTNSERSDLPFLCCASHLRNSSCRKSCGFHRDRPQLAGHAIQALWGSILVLSGEFRDLLNYMGGAGSLLCVLGIAAVFVMRFKHP